MDFIRIMEECKFKHPVYGEGLLEKGKTYFSYSQFARETAKAGLGTILEEEKPSVLSFTPNHLDAPEDFKKILLVFAGGLGDAITCGIVLPEVVRNYGIGIDICCDRSKWDNVFRPMGMSGLHVPYPPDLDTLKDYDGVLSDITCFYPSRDGLRFSPVMELIKGFRLKAPEIRPFYEVPEDVTELWRLPSANTIRIGVNLDSNGLVKSYPPDLYGSLLRCLEDTGFEIFLLGLNRTGCGYDSQRIRDLRSKTAIPESAAVIRQMDLVIGVDSFTVHLAHLLGTRSLVLLSSTCEESFSWHENIQCLSSKLECAPCYSLFDKCPANHQGCMAFYHDSVDPYAIVKCAARMLAEKFSAPFQ
ncbi:MAG: hypothetical protein C4576_11630 [Desulfobacteraceae bacterium]|nr:MAG: hypothetical protein C4576_11630 [Desulfobacteraceae bacterium]